MELFIFVLMKYLGYFLFMIIFGTIAVITAKNITAKKRVSWICYAIGAGAQLFALIGNQKQANYYGYDVSTYWFVYFFLLIVFAVLIAMREGAAYYDGCGKKNKRTLVKKEAEQGKIPNEDANVGAIPAMINTKENGKEDSKAHSWNLTVSIVLSALSCVAIIVAMNMQDAQRNNWEAINPTLIYFVLLGVEILCLLGTIAYKRKWLGSVGVWLAILPAIVTIFALVEGSVFAGGGFYVKHYQNEIPVLVCNCIWAIASLVSPIIISPLLIRTMKKGQAFPNVSGTIHSSVRYREKCYKRIAVMHDYLERGIITQEEYDQIRKDILKNVK